jgi:hypothetical protein
MPETKAQLTDRIRTLLTNNDMALETGLLRIYERQTAAEQATQTTTEHNGRGFSAFDATILSSFAEQIKANRYGRGIGRRLTDRQRAIARAKMVHYAGQLAGIAEEKAARVVASGHAPLPREEVTRRVQAFEQARSGWSIETEEEQELARSRGSNIHMHSEAF